MSIGVNEVRVLASNLDRTQRQIQDHLVCFFQNVQLYFKENTTMFVLRRDVS
jgi:hypothetical protein